MRWNKVLILVAVVLVCVNARVLKRQKKTRQRAVTAPCNCPPPIQIQCGCNSILEPTYGGFGTCNCQNIFLDELSNYRYGCQYVDSYGILNPEMSNYGRVPVTKLPKMAASYDAGAPVPAINLPGLFDLVVDLPGCQTMPPYVADLPSCQCQSFKPSYQFIDSPCGCRCMQKPFVEYLSPDLPSPLLTVPFQAPKCLPQVVQLPPCGCQTMPCSCENGIKVSYGLPCGCQNSCGCQNAMQYGPQYPALEAPCACQTCQLSPVDLPVFGYGCQSLAPPAIGCGGKYLRQVTLQPPFL